LDNGLNCGEIAISYPSGDNYKFLSSHEWARIEGDIATTGISDHAQDELGDVVYVELPEVGQVVEQGKQFSAIESVKAASDLYAPMSGKVTEVNKTLEDNSEVVNASPYEEGWIAKIELSDRGEFDQLLSFEEYSKKLEET
jgi:glycine cleavage system H protein